MALGQQLFHNRMYYDGYLHFVRKGHFVIVDNGAAEGDDIDFRNVAHAAMELNADEIVLPDKLRDRTWTWMHSTDSTTLALVPRNKRFIVPQGRDWDEWESSLLDLVAQTEPVTIGIAKHLETLAGGRPHALEIIKSLGFQHRFNIHLLGIWQKPFAEVLDAWAVLPTIRGIDTSAPIAYAQNGRPIGDSEHYSLKWERSDHNQYFYQNVITYSSWLGMLRPGLEKKDVPTPESSRSFM